MHLTRPLWIGYISSYITNKNRNWLIVYILFSNSVLVFTESSSMVLLDQDPPVRRAMSASLMTRTHGRGLMGGCAPWLTRDTRGDLKVGTSLMASRRRLVTAVIDESQISRVTCDIPQPCLLQCYRF